MMSKPLAPSTKTAITKIFAELDYKILGPVYCYEGGDEFWQAKRKPCERLGTRIALALRDRLAPQGRSLYVGAGVAELPPLLMEALDLQREIAPCNLRRTEVAAINRACRSLPVRFHPLDAAKAKGRFDHIWMVSVLNDPERFPDLAPLSYGNANPVTFDPKKFEQQRRIVRALVDRVMPKLSLPGLVTTSTEEVVWIADWCHRKKIPYLVERAQFPTALVGDPVCFMKIGSAVATTRRSRTATL
ncbi:MAG: hypothetical protein IT389_08845 [Nitrospira sp.]|nr:hypothetical protein [Nitrospira sp.]